MGGGVAGRQADGEEAGPLLEELKVEVLPSVQFYKQGQLLWEHRGIIALQQVRRDSAASHPLPSPSALLSCACAVAIRRDIIGSKLHHITQLRWVSLGCVINPGTACRKPLWRPLRQDLGEGVLYYGDQAAEGLRPSTFVQELSSQADLNTFVQCAPDLLAKHDCLGGGAAVSPIDGRWPFQSLIQIMQVLLDILIWICISVLIWICISTATRASSQASSHGDTAMQGGDRQVGETGGGTRWAQVAARHHSDGGDGEPAVRHALRARVPRRHGARQEHAGALSPLRPPAGRNPSNRGPLPPCHLHIIRSRRSFFPGVRAGVCNLCAVHG